jgi:hypothetical protein
MLRAQYPELTEAEVGEILGFAHGIAAAHNRKR